MDKQDIERRLEAAEKQNLGLIDEIKYLKEQLAQMQDESEIPDEPEFKMDDKLYFLETWTGIIENSCVDDEIDFIDFNMFHTEEYAQEFANKCKLIAMMLHCKWYLDRDYVPDWNNHDVLKFLPRFDHSEHEFDADTWLFVEHIGVFFSTKEKAQKCADWLNKHWKEDTDE